MIHPLRYGLGNLPVAEAHQGVANASDTKAEAVATAKASDELTEDDLEAVAGRKVSPIIEPIWKTPGAPPILKD